MSRENELTEGMAKVFADRARSLEKELEALATAIGRCDNWQEHRFIQVAAGCAEIAQHAAFQIANNLATAFGFDIPDHPTAPEEESK